MTYKINHAEDTPSDPMTLPQRAARALGGRWRAGMLVRYEDELGLTNQCRCEGGDSGQVLIGPHWAPVLTDPATLGAILAVVRAAWGPLFTVHSLPPTYPDRGEPWAVYARHSGQGLDSKGLREINFVGFTGATEGEALVAALEATASPQTSTPPPTR